MYFLKISDSRRPSSLLRSRPPFVLAIEIWTFSIFVNAHCRFDDVRVCVLQKPFSRKKNIRPRKGHMYNHHHLVKTGGGGSFFLLEMKPSMYIRFWIEGTWIAVEKRNHVSFEVVTIRELVRYKVKKRAEADWKRHWRERVYICVTLKVSHWFYDGCLVWFGNEIVLFSISFFLGRTQDKTIDISECA